MLNGELFFFPYAGPSPVRTRTVYPERLRSSPSRSRWSRSSSPASSRSPSRWWSKTWSDGKQDVWLRVEPGLTVKLREDSQHVSPRLLALRFTADDDDGGVAPGGRRVVPLDDEEDASSGCYYAGRVMGEPDSRVILSLCGGVVSSRLLLRVSLPRT